MSRRFYVLYDGRASGGVGTDNASVICTARSDGEARRDARDYGEVACYSYGLISESTTEFELADDEQWEWDWNDREGKFTPE